MTPQTKARLIAAIALPLLALTSPACRPGAAAAAAPQLIQMEHISVPMTARDAR